MSRRRFTISIMRCPQTRVYIGISEDIPGLTLESDTFGKLLEAVMEVVPDLLMHNLGLPEDELDNVTVKLVEKEMSQAFPTTDRADRVAPRPHPRYYLDAVAVAA